MGVFGVSRASEVRLQCLAAKDQCVRERVGHQSKQLVDARGGLPELRLEEVSANLDQDLLAPVRLNEPRMRKIQENTSQVFGN